ncbi:hypothetical protein CALVIDRAFT_326751 [Calocera viscosa TUFC12733]|uniref:Uncharacterized protein n=1 Tax=Calocera viscosa (strain TUFC12733) TaxID=1330018 RepID=A0A167QUW5_CALVF|nr:hypothetical protein CALVIDRAFT_326751 [Calocera viscosa TUFC12733]
MMLMPMMWSSLEEESMSLPPPPRPLKPPEPPSLAEEEILNLDADPDPPQEQELELGEEEMEGMRRRVEELGYGQAVNGRKPREAELAGMVLRLTDPALRAPVQETLAAQAESISQLRQIAHAQRTFFAASAEASRAGWEAERQGWQRVAAALGERMRRAEEGGRLSEVRFFASVQLRC